MSSNPETLAQLLLTLEAGPRSLEDLELSLGVPTPALNLAIGDLRNDHLIHEAVSGGRVLVDLTAKGRALVRRKKEEASRDFQRLLRDKATRKEVFKEVAFKEIWAKAPPSLKNERGRMLVLERIDQLLRKEGY